MPEHASHSIPEIAPLPLSRITRSAATGEGIKNLILARGLKPGDPLPSEQYLIDTLGVSRSSVREAVRHLQALDIVTVKQGSGTYVGALSMDPLVEALVFRAEMTVGADRSTLAEVVQVRRYLDLGIGSLICTRLKGTRQDALRAIVDEMVRAADAGKLFTEADYRFHNGLLEQSGNEVVRQLVNSLWRVHQIVLPNLSPKVITSRLAETARSHGHILDAACAGDVDAYAAAVDEHYKPIDDILSHPEL